MAFKLVCYKAFTIYSRDEDFMDLLNTNPDLAFECLSNAIKNDYSKFSEHKQSAMLSYLKYRLCQSFTK